MTNRESINHHRTKNYIALIVKIFNVIYQNVHINFSL